MKGSWCIGGEYSLAEDLDGGEGEGLGVIALREAPEPQSFRDPGGLDDCSRYEFLAGERAYDS